jgi:deoxycytidine triphosphate deaminase
MAIEQNGEPQKVPSGLEKRIQELERRCRAFDGAELEQRVTTLEGAGYSSQLTTLEARIAELEAASTCQVPDCTGGVLSSADFERLVVHRGHPDYRGHKFEEFLDSFRERSWDRVDGKIVIQPFDKLNLTPFSYDLSVGGEVLSVRESERKRYRLPFDLEPRETAIILTREFIALPPDYAATVWPRFSMVREGLFQSMVKIDPTWFGHLAVALCNLSPRTYTLKENTAFGTLILYGLASQTTMDLHDPSRLPIVDVDIEPVTR